MALFSPVDLADPMNFPGGAAAARFINSQLKPQRLTSLTDFLKSRSPIEEADVRKAIRLIMCTPEYQLT